VWFSSFLTGILSFETIVPLSWICSVLRHQTLLLQFHSMCMFVTSIQRSLFILTIEPNSICRSLPKCFRQLLQSFHAQIKELFHLKPRLQATIRSVQTCLAATGALVRANPRSVRITTSMGFAVSVVKDTERRTTNGVSLSSRLATERESLGAQENVAMFVEKGPRSLTNPSLKCRASVTLDDVILSCLNEQTNKLTLG
jgi:hypothetical protein